MKLPFRPKTTLCTLVLAACSLVAANAQAQSEEYRRGYEQGYHDGAEAQSHADHGGPQGLIIIEEAHYAAREITREGFREVAACDARGTIQHMVGWRRHFDVPVNNNLCGDPAFGVPKHLFVRYRCGDSQSARVEAPENAILQLSCQ